MKAYPQSKVASAAGARNTPNGTCGSSSRCVAERKVQLRLGAGATQARQRIRSDTTNTKRDDADHRADEHDEQRPPGSDGGADDAMSVTSPNPIASFLRATSPNQPAMAIAPAPAHAPIIASYGSANGDALIEHRADDRRHEDPQQAEHREAVGDEIVLARR